MTPLPNACGPAQDCSRSSRVDAVLTLLTKLSFAPGRIPPDSCPMGIRLRAWAGVWAVLALVLLTETQTIADDRLPVRLGLIDLALDHDALAAFSDVTVRSITFEATRYRKARFQSADHAEAHADVMARALIESLREVDPELPIELYVASPFMEDRDTGQLIIDLDQLRFAYDWLAMQDVRIVAQTFVGFDSDLQRQALDHAMELGLVVLSSAGNGPQENPVPPYPAAYPETISISTTGLVRELGREADRDSYVDYSIAPQSVGSLRLRRNPQLRVAQGSSWATASAAGLLGALTSRFSVASRSDAIQVLDVFALPLEQAPHGQAYGRGVLVTSDIAQRFARDLPEICIEELRLTPKSTKAI